MLPLKLTNHEDNMELQLALLAALQRADEAIKRMNFTKDNDRYFVTIHEIMHSLVGPNSERMPK